VACYLVDGSGGTLGPDLTGVYTKLGEVPLVSACEKASFKIMSAAYKDHPLTKQEALHLTKYFAAVAQVRVPRADPPVAAYGATAAVAGMAALALAYRKRASGIRRDLSRRRN
jgi:hypothetical protein